MFANAENKLRADITSRINTFATSRPRALQREVGCSSLGTDCDRKLGYQILGVNTARRKTAGWMATIGTAVHAWLETVFTDDDDFITETPVTVKHRDLEIPGTVDLYSKTHAAVIDFKVVGESTLAKARAGRISRQYSVQVQLYGLGLQQAGYKVSTVAILFLPRNKELSDAVLWEAPFDKAVAAMALDRFALIRNSVTTGGIDALAGLGTEDAPCVWCDYYNPASTELAKGCPGKPLTTTINKLVV